LSGRAPVIASEAKQSIAPQESMDCFVASLLAMTTLRRGREDIQPSEMAQWVDSWQ
jgi:hypothetical protein